ncbi:MAG: hypothetical protein JHD02_11260 [Thermoleophilaceae bacterium]|nr:hypothetical protein [Thermoleophilaceae bacterium]
MTGLVKVLALVPFTVGAIFATPAAATPALDTTFGGGVISPKAFPKGKWLQVARDAVIQDDGKVLVPMALSVKYGRRAERPVLRYSRDGAIDRSYGKNGAAWFGIEGQKYVGLTGISLQPDGKAVVFGGTAKTRAGLDAYFVARLTRSGKLDKGFGRRGVTRLAAIREWDREILGTFSLEDGRTIVAIKQSHANDDTLDLVRLKKDGTVDRGYADHGIKSLDFANGQSFPDFADIAVFGDEAYVLVNPDTESVRHPCKLVRTSITSRGGRVKAFGNNGSVAIAASKPGNAVSCERLTLTGDGGVAVVGSEFFGDYAGTSAGVAYKFRQDGSRDPAFGVGGKIQAPDQHDFSGIAALPGGDFLVLGNRRDSEDSSVRLGGIASNLDASGGIQDLLAGNVLKNTDDSYLSNIDHGPAGNVAVYTRFSTSGEGEARVAKFTN